MLGGGNQVKDYTHIVGVSRVVREGYGYSESDAASYITPSNRFKCFAYDGVYEFELTTLVTKELVSNGLRDWAWEDLNFYLGRQDTNAVFYSKAYSEEYYDPEYGIVYLPMEFFDSNDMNKEIPIWLSNTPPPLVRQSQHRSFRGHCWRRLIATLTERWHDARQNLKSIFCHQIKNHQGLDQRHYKSRYWFNTKSNHWISNPRREKRFNCNRVQLAVGGYHV